MTHHIPRTPAQLAHPALVHRSSHSAVSVNTRTTGESTQSVRTSKLEMHWVDGVLQVRFIEARMVGQTRLGDAPCRPRRM
ncbi:hypothetical protein RD110_07990 [Rhodoferax koreense]|uniref:Uncharacterized protein n=1 Tax=Rhodoferax koreensis TaxID=1842727 RepID=A0A1P8JTQ3_9BURK|nr:hypothetical protein [Rhodoferax koreense]APW37144.1 hypothetical protein RD110_07990 [Rhodoferax koreense]